MKPSTPDIEVRDIRGGTTIPGGHCFVHVPTRGACWLESGLFRERIRAGDCVLLTDAPTHRLESSSGARVVVARYPLGTVPPLGIITCRGALTDSKLVSGLSIDAVREEYESAAGATTDVALRLVDLICAALVRRGRQARGVDSQDDPVERTLEMMRSAVDRPWSVAELARAAGMSKSVFAARFAEAVGEPPLACLRRFRLSLAASLLRASDLKLSEVARRVGYATDAALSKAFARYYGMSPGRYRVGERSDDPVPQLVRYGSPQDAVGPLLARAHGSHARGRYDDALDSLELRDRFLDRMGVGRDGAPRIPGAILRSRCLGRVGDVGAAEEVARRAQDLAARLHRPPDVARALEAVAFPLTFVRDFQGAQESLDDATRLGSGSTADSARIQLGKGLLQLYRGEYPTAAAHYERAGAIAERGGHAALQAEALPHVAAASLGGGDRVRAQAAAEQGLLACRGYPLRLGQCELILGDLALEEGRLQDAAAHYELGVAALVAVQSYDVEVAQAKLGGALMAQGSWRDGERATLAALQRASTNEGITAVLAWARAALAFHASEHGMWSAFDHHLDAMRGPGSGSYYRRTQLAYLRRTLAQLADQRARHRRVAELMAHLGARG